jgi:hypothetical protein
LIAEDAGRYDEASRYFNQAVRLDPNFGAAQQKGQEASQAAAGTVSASTVESGLRGTSEGAVVQAATQGTTNVGTTANVSTAGLTSTVQATAGDINPSAIGIATGAGVTTSNAAPQKDPVSAGTGTDNPSVTGKVVIVIKRP